MQTAALGIEKKIFIHIVFIYIVLVVSVFTHVAEMLSSCSLLMMHINMSSNNTNLLSAQIQDAGCGSTESGRQENSRTSPR